MEQQARCYAVLRRQRHSLFNHLQVISGWLQLNQPDRAEEYLESLVAQLTAESEVLRHLPPALGLVAADLMLEAESLGLPLEWRLAGDPAGHRGTEQAQSAEAAADARATEAAADAQATEAAAALRRAARLPGPRRRAVVMVGPEGLSVHTPPGEGEG